MTSVRALTQRTGDGLVGVDEEQRIVSWNDAVSRMLGLREELVLGRPCYDALECLDGEGRPLCKPGCSIFRSVRQGEEMASHDMLLKRRDGSYLRCSLSFLAMDDGSDFARAFFLIRPYEDAGAENASGPAADPVAQLQLRCFGSFEVWLGGSRLSGPPLSRKKAGRALRFLIHRRGQKVPRDELAEVLWTGVAPDTARARLKVIMHALRRGLEPGLATQEPSRFIGYENDCYFFTEADGCSIDVDSFLERAQAGQECHARRDLAQARAHYLEAIRLYRGDYLAEDLYEDWSGGERQRFREIHISTLVALASIYASGGEFDRAVDCCWQALRDDSCREFVYRHLMDYLWRDGRSDEAIRAYHRCEAVLRRELRLQPLPETTDLYRQITAQPSGVRCVAPLHVTNL